MRGFGVYYKNDKRTEIIFYIHQKILSVASWVLRFCEVLPCDGCIHHDDYGCMRLFINERCSYEE